MKLFTNRTYKKVFICRYLFNTNTVKLQVVTESPISLFKEVAKIAQILTKERKANERYILIYANTKAEALAKLQYNYKYGG